MEELLEKEIKETKYIFDKNKYIYVVCTSPGSRYEGSLGYYTLYGDGTSHISLYYINSEIGNYSDTVSIASSKSQFRVLTDEEKVKYADDVKILERSAEALDFYTYISNYSEEIYSRYIESTDGFKSLLTQDYLKSLNQEFFDQVDVIKKLTEEVYDSGNIFISSDTRTNTFHVNILFDNITITNSQKKLHTIKDLIVRIPIKYDKAKKTLSVVENIYGTKLTYSYEEYKSNYVHSHLQSANRDVHFSMFCLGASDIAVMNSDLRLKFSETKYLLFLNMLTTYVNWESLEGGPYRKISEISSRDRAYALTSTYSTFLSKWVSENQIDFNISFDVVSKQFKVLRDSKLEGEIKRLVDAHPDAKENYYCFRGSEGNEYVKSRTKESIDKEIVDLTKQFIVSDDIRALKFGNKPDLKPNIYNNIVDDTTENVISKQAINHAATSIENHLNTHFLKKNA